jgi:hypothetical protein
MQPYFLPYLGYFHLVDAVDAFVILDTVKYPKGGWVNRNRILIEGVDRWLTLPVSSRASSISEKSYVLDHRDFIRIEKMVSRAYSRSPRLGEFQALLAEWWHSPIRNVSETNMFFVRGIMERLGRVLPRFVNASSVQTDGATGQDRILKIAQNLGATSYVNLIGGQRLYQKSAFNAVGMELFFVRSQFREYTQKSPEFVPGLSVLDLFLNETRDAESWIGPESYSLFSPNSNEIT